MSIALKLMNNKVADYCKKTSNRHQEENYTCDGFFILYKHFYTGQACLRPHSRHNKMIKERR